ncbi:putative c2h2 type zinc finger domain protein [Golovinomyces cichoracearum]|uniref:Putative c2h2 type zinc finger domain protein n=1 Tax=Golovinomyces cichoracearum TaxID=62708 RepID=A0A420J4Q4_9PEZI|nr:putative c2h2 type zinc finger domain protein [Golovinomyces cichoracearum]
MAKRSWTDFEDLSLHEISSETTTPTAPNSEVHSLIAENGSRKFIQLDIENETAPTPVIYCSLPPHRRPLEFYSFEEHEIHYAKVHTNRCLKCNKILPSDHLLSLHIEENHNVIFTLKIERGDKMYACFVEDCNRLCSTPQKRRMHLIDKHFFSKEYDFNIVNHGIGNRNSMLRSCNRKTRGPPVAYLSSKAIAKNSGMNVHDTISSAKPLNESRQRDTDADELITAISALKFLPLSVRLGGKKKTDSKKTQDSSTSKFLPKK